MAINPYQSVLPGTEGNVIPKVNPYQNVIPGTTGNVLAVPPPTTTTLAATNIGATPIQIPKTPTPIVPTMPAPLAPTEGGVQLTQNADGTVSRAATQPTTGTPAVGAPPPSIDQQATAFAQAQAPTETPAEAQQTQLQSRFTQLYEKLFGKPQAQQQAETAQGIPQKSQAVADIQAQINQLQNDANVAMIKAQTMGETSSFGNAQIAQIERDRTVKALQLNSFLFAAQGNLATAQDMADRAVKAQFEPVELEINYLKEFLDMNEKNMDRADKKRAEALRLQLDERTRLLEEKKAERTAINSISIEAAQAGADALMLNKINSATTQEEALQIATSDPKLLSWAKTMQEEKFAEEKRQFGMTYALAQQKAGEAGTNGDNQQLYAGLKPQTATAVRGQVSAFKSEPTIQNFAVVQEGRNFAQSLSDTTKNPADDQGLIYSLAKALDPGSVVREGEYATAQKYAQSWVKAYGKGVEQALLGTGFLSVEARKNIKKTIESKYNASRRSYDNLYNQYTGGINNLTGRNDGTLFLRDYIVPEQETPVNDITSLSDEDFLSSIPTEEADNKSFFGGIYNWITGK